jgi:transcriptional regulator with XRE-family HTH domain
VAERTKRRQSFVAADSPIAERIGSRLRRARTQAKLTQAQLAEGRYTKAYVSALENGLVKPSMAALHYFAARLQVPIEQFLADRDQAWTRLEADLRLAAGDWGQAVDAYAGLLEGEPTEFARAELLLGMAEGLGRLGRGADTVRAASDAAVLFERQGRRGHAAWATYWQAFGLYELEQGDQASSLLEGILDQVAGGLSVDPDLPVRALIALAVVASRDDRPERALGFLEQARARLGELDDQKRAKYLLTLAMSYRELGDYEAAISTGDQSLAAFKVAETGLDTASLENLLALVYMELGNLREARRHAAQARDYFERVDDRRWLAHVTETDGQIALAAGEAAEAGELATQALTLAEETGNRKAAVSSLLLMGRAQRAAGDLRSASASLERAAAVAEELGRRSQSQMILGEWSDVMADLGDMTRAYELSRRALDAGRR